MTPFRDRVRELRREPAGLLRPHPRNWRRHPAEQSAALEAVLEEVGFAGAVLARECADGTLELIDGHLRAATAADAEVPVLIVDLDEREAELLLAVHDPLAALAATDAATLAALRDRTEAERAEVCDLIDGVLAAAKRTAATIASAAATNDAPPPLAWREAYQIVVECRDEPEQRALYDRLVAEGRACRLIML